MISVRAPEYFPSLRYCAMMASVDQFVIADTFQYSRQSYQNRCRVRTPEGRQWMSIPLGGGQHGRDILAVKIDHSQNWKRKHEKALEFNYGATPFFEYYAPDIMRCLGAPGDILGDLTVATVELVYDLLGLSCELVRLSSMQGEEGIQSDHELLLWDRQEPVKNSHKGGINFMTYEHPAYRQQFDGFEAGLSVLDLLFNHGPESTRILRSGIQITRL